MPKLSARNHGAERGDAGAGVRERGEVGNYQHFQDDAGNQRRHIAEAQRAEPAGGDADEGGDQTDRRAHGADGVLRQPEVVVERVVHRPGHVLGELIEADHREHQEREPDVDAKELGERTDDRVEETARRPQRRLGLGRERLLRPQRFRGDQARATPTAISAAMTP